MAIYRIQPRRGTAAAWTSADPVLAVGELGYETDTGRSKRGNGTDTWGDLDYIDARSLRADVWDTHEIGIRTKTSPTYGTGYVFGTASSFGFAGTGSPPDIAGAWGIYQQFGVDTPNQPIYKTCQGGYVITTYSGPTDDDGANGLSSITILSDTGTPFTQALPVVGMECGVQVQGGNEVSGGGSYVQGCGSRIELATGTSVDEAYSFKASYNTTGGTGTADRYIGFYQPVTAATATAKYGVYTIDTINSETKLSVGSSVSGTSKGIVEITADGDGRGTPSLVYLQSPSVSSGGPDIAVLGLRAGASATGALLNGIDSSGVIRFAVSRLGTVIHKGVQFGWQNDSGVQQVAITGGSSVGSVTLASGVNLVLDATSGTKIGTATTQKLGFWNATPAVQPAAVADATDAASVITQLNTLLSRLRAIGVIAT